MDSRVRRINRILKDYDTDLFCARDGECLHVYRKKPRMQGSFEYEGATYAYTGVENQYIFSMTHNWKFEGRPVEWGMDNIVSHLNFIDSWKNDDYEKFVKLREQKEKWREESKSNNRRALAADMRKDFARATNDIVVHNLK